MSASSPLPPGISPPLSTDNPNNHSGLIVVITSLYLVLIIVALVTRISVSFTRRIMQHNNLSFGVLIVVATTQAAVVLVQVHEGWGIRTKLGQTTSDRMLKTGYAAEILSIVVLGCSKISTCLFYSTLFSQIQKMFIRINLVGMVVWTILSVILLAVRCSRNPWVDISDAQCSSLLPRWQAITAIDIATEASLFVYTAIAVQKIQISTRKKLVVFIALQARVLLIPLAGLRLYYAKLQITSDDPILLGAFATVITEIYLAISVLCVVSAFFKSFIAAYEDGNGISYTNGTSGSHSKSRRMDSRNTFTQHKDSNDISGVLRGWEREEDPIIGPTDPKSGLKIYTSVHFSVRDENIELADRESAEGRRGGF
ncbi:hypothetical protein N7447_003929 [Penicillium robsamsonii]|uniref:uncharacterized protein n=1 Tax=Penicillium robsamsonii TaxID=1792511 RepID=UPI002549A66A|nr:uncharacterized protein N7447_003929 [Penicillium robsamsonii]KAJ5827166.1 hypothetical protein N7447_003929 [Penicillium robsamsonii]